MILSGPNGPANRVVRLWVRLGNTGPLALGAVVKESVVILFCLDTTKLTVQTCNRKGLGKRLRS